MNEKKKQYKMGSIIQISQETVTMPMYIKEIKHWSQPGRLDFLTIFIKTWNFPKNQYERL